MPGVMGPHRRDALGYGDLKCTHYLLHACNCYHIPMDSTHKPAGIGDGAGEDGKRAGGLARAAKLTPEQRKRSARAAARARWSKEVTKAVAGDATTPLTINETEIECYVLEDGTRVISQASFLRSLGRGKMSGARKELPPFLASLSVRDYLTDDILADAEPIDFTLPNNTRAKGYRATLLPVVCELYLQARHDGKLPPNQEHIAKQAEILIRGLARVGIIALVDEATGYQAVRAKNALVEILEEFVAKELRAWVKTFPDDFYRELCRLRRIDFPKTMQFPPYVGKLTNDIVYNRLAPGVLDELKRVKKASGKGSKLHQHLTDNAGYPKLVSHLGSVVTLMKMSNSWDEFTGLLDKFHPVFDEVDSGRAIEP